MPVRKSVFFKTIVVVAVAFAATVGPAAADHQGGKKLNRQHRMLSTEHADLSAQLDAIQNTVEALVPPTPLCFQATGSRARRCPTRATATAPSPT